MSNVTREDAIINVPADVMLPLIVLVAVVVYCVAMGAVVLIIYAKYPQRLKQSAAPPVIVEMASYMDCSAILQCLPCTDCSFRRVLRNTCPNTEPLRRLINCECVRPPLQGVRGGADLGCCIVCSEP